MKFKTYSVNNSKMYIREKRELLAGIDVLIGTPDRIERHRENNNLFFS